MVAALSALALAGLRAAAGQSATSPAATASRAKIERIDHFEYQPTPLTIPAGTRVVFSNTSRVTHTATENGGGFDSGEIRPGESAAITLRKPGTYVFHCEIHPFMHGKIIVR